MHAWTALVKAREPPVRTVHLLHRKRHNIAAPARAAKHDPPVFAIGVYDDKRLARHLIEFWRRFNDGDPCVRTDALSNAQRIAKS
jgi:hypothetical protein